MRADEKRYDQYRATVIFRCDNFDHILKKTLFRTYFCIKSCTS